MAALAAAGVVVMGGPAHAPQHFILVREVFAGVAASPNAQYVELQMFASGQNFVAGTSVMISDAAGNLVSTFTFTGDVAVGATQSSILVATSDAQTFFGVTPDLTMGSAAIPKEGGKVCFTGSGDCVSWGAYSASSAGVGTPFNAPEGIPAGAAILRRISGGSSATMLDSGDDTNNSAADFAYSQPQPRNNAGTQGEAAGGAFTFAAAPAPVSESAGSATVTVNRVGGTTGAVQVAYSTSDGTATAGADYTDSDGTLSFAAGQTTGAFQVPVLDDAAAEPPESVRLALRNPTGGAVLGDTPDATLTILGSDDTAAPQSKIEKPKHGRSYTPSMIRKLTGSATDGTGSGVAEAEIALRKRLEDGTCRWWNGKRFVRRKCGAKLFVRAKFVVAATAAAGGRISPFNLLPATRSWAYRLSKPLEPSVGTDVRGYTLFSRATDEAGNVETAFELRRNVKRFEVT